MKKFTILSIVIIALSLPQTGNAIDKSCTLRRKEAYKTSLSADIYYITENCTKQIFPNESVFFTYFKSMNEVILVDDLTLRFIPSDPEKYVSTLGPRDGSSGSTGGNTSGSTGNNTSSERAISLAVGDGSIIKSPGRNEVYIVINNVKFHIKNMETLQELGIPLQWVETVSQKTIDSISSGTSLDVYTNSRLMSAAMPNFILLKDRNSPAVYRVEPSSKDPKYQVLRKISNETALRKIGYRLDRLPQVTLAEIPELAMIGVNSRSVFRIGNELTANSNISYEGTFSQLIDEKRSAKNEGAYLRDEKYEGISYEYPWRYKVVRGFSYSGAFRDEYNAIFTIIKDEKATLDLTISPLPKKSSSYTSDELDELVRTSHDNYLKAQFPDLSNIRRSSTDLRRQPTYGYTKTTNLETYSGDFEKRITFVYKNQIFAGVIHYTQSSTSGTDADLENLLYYIASTFKKTN